MSISRHNYEAWLLDASEGRLSPAQLLALRAFLLANPDLEQDFEGLPSFDGGDEKYPEASLLFRDEPSPEELLIIRYLEQDLSPQEQSALEKRLLNEHGLREKLASFSGTYAEGHEIQFPGSNLLYKDLPDSRNEAALEVAEGLRIISASESEDADFSRLVSEYGSIKAVPDESVIFAEKALLYREGRVVKLSLTVWSRAAAVVVLAGLAAVLLWPSKHIGPVAGKSSDSHAVLISPLNEERIPTKHTQTKVVQSYGAGIKKQLKEPHRAAPPVIKRMAEEAMTAGREEPAVALSQPAPETVSPVQEVSPITVPDTSALVITSFDMLPVESDEAVEEKNVGFWVKAADVLGKLRKLGVKGVESEMGDRSIVLTVSSVSVEKKMGGM